LPPNSKIATEYFLSSVSRCAKAHPAEPAPIII